MAKITLSVTELQDIKLALQYVINTKESLSDGYVNRLSGIDKKISECINALKVEVAQSE